MTTYIGNVPLASIQEVVISSTEENEEIDLVDKDKNIVLSGNDGGQDISINATLVESLHPENASIETQRDQLKTLAGQDFSENDFLYKSFEGHVSVSNISVPEQSDSKTLRNVEIEGIYLPWPKHLPETPPGKPAFVSGEFSIVSTVDGLAFILIPISSDLTVTIEQSGRIESYIVSSATVNQTLTTGGSLSSTLSMVSDALVSLMSSGNLTFVPLSITTTATLNGQTFDLTVYEDTNGDGTPDNQQTISVASGTNTYELNNLDGRGGNEVWSKIDISTTDQTSTAVVDSLNIDRIEPWETATDWDSAQSESGVVHESVTNTDHNDATAVKQGYSAEAPFLVADLVGYYPLHEDSGTTLYDLSGNARDGSYTGATLGQTGLLGTTAPSFDGVDDRGTIPHDTAFDSATYTVTGWFRTANNSQNQGLCGKFTGGNGWYLGVAFDGDGDGNYEVINYVRSSSGNADYIYTDNHFTDGNWHHVAAMRSGTGASGLNIYVDAVDVTTTIGSDNGSAAPATTQDIAIGDRDAAGGWPLDGQAADVRYYNRVLTASEIQTLHDVVEAPGNLTTSKRTI